MTPSLNQTGNNFEKCKICLIKHPGPCKNPKYLANKAGKCGCEYNEIQFDGYENHCCVCKKGMHFAKAEWGQIEGRIRC